MKVSTNNALAYGTVGRERSFELLKSAGFDAIDYAMFFSMYKPFDGMFAKDMNEFIAFFKEEASYSEKYSLPVGQTHAPFSDYPKTPEIYDFMVQAMKKTLIASSILGSPYMVMHSLMPKGWGPDTSSYTKDENYKLLSALIPVAQEYGVKIAIENLPCKYIPTSTYEEHLEFIKMMDSEYVVGCFDTGHSFLAGINPADAVRYLGKYLKVLHVHDNSGDTDTHTWPYLGKIDWADFTSALKSIGYEGTLSLEAQAVQAKMPKELYAMSERASYEIGKHLAELSETC